MNFIFGTKLQTFLWFLKCYEHFFEVRTLSEMRTWVRGPHPGPDRPDSVRTGSGLLYFEKLRSGPGPDLDLPGSGLFEKMRTFAIPATDSKIFSL